MARDVKLENKALLENKTGNKSTVTSEALYGGCGLEISYRWCR